MKVANRFTRLCIFIIDQIAFLFIIFLHSLVLDGLLGLVPKDGSPWLGIYSLALYVLYYCLFEFYFGKTPGKFLTGTIVVTEDGNRASFKTLLIRSIVRLIPLDALSFLFSLGWHDQISRTIVINNSD
jgi:uncharacterized RDD family membrane protein YckC